MDLSFIARSRRVNVFVSIDFAVTTLFRRSCSHWSLAGHSQDLYFLDLLGLCRGRSRIARTLGPEFHPVASLFHTGIHLLLYRFGVYDGSLFGTRG